MLALGRLLRERFRFQRAQRYVTGLAIIAAAYPSFPASTYRRANDMRAGHVETP
jgi:hypothetical protein